MKLKLKPWLDFAAEYKHVLEQTCQPSRKYLSEKGIADDS